VADSLQSTFFQTEITGAVAHFIMNRPEKANCMSPDFWEDLPRLVRQCETDDVIRAIVISGEGRHFTSGMDLSTFQGVLGLLDGEPGRASFALRELILKLQGTFSALDNSPLPVIAAIHGACVGGGIDLITACDIRVASIDAYFSIEEINIGMAADVGTLQRLPKLIPPGIARELALTGRRFSAQEANGWGLVNTLYESRQEMIDGALQLAADLASKSPLAISGTKMVSNYARDHSVADGLEQIALWNAGMLRPKDLMTAIEAKMSKKDAVFEDLKKRDAM